MGSHDKTKASLSRWAAAYDDELFSSDATPLPVQRLLYIARQSDVAEPSSCAATLLLLSTGRAVRHGLHRIMKPLGMSEARFLTLVTLYTLDPAPSCPANLAYHVEVTRTAMTDTLDQMGKKGWVRRERLDTDRRVVRVFLTDHGREIAAGAIRRFLEAASAMAENLKPTQHKVFGAVCLKLRQRAEALIAG